MKALIACGFCLFFWALPVFACPYGAGDNLLKLRLAADYAIVRIDTLGPGVCTTTGTGFFVDSKGHVATAGHIVPSECDGKSTINVTWTIKAFDKTLTDPVSAKVISRSAESDVAVLELNGGNLQDRQYLKLPSSNGDDAKYKLQCVLLASHYSEQLDSYLTFAEIASVTLDSDPRWALSGEGFNPSRSGSPVILDDGRVVAMFVARPEDETNRAKIIQSRAYITPLGRISPTEINLADLQKSTGQLPSFLTPTKTPAVTSDNQNIRTTFGISITEPGFRLDGPIYVVASDTNIVKVDSNVEALGFIALNGGSVASAVDVHREFAAIPGYQFLPATVKIVHTSLRPKATPLPINECSLINSTDCFALTSDRSKIDFRFHLYPGRLDATRSWIDAEISVTQSLK